MNLEGKKGFSPLHLWLIYLFFWKQKRGGFGKVKLAESETVTGRGTAKCQYAIKISNK